MLWVPLDANAPLKPLVPVQAVALVELQVNVAAPPYARSVELAVNVAVGAAGLT